jgi:hypothetical protein
MSAALGLGLLIVGLAYLALAWLIPGMRIPVSAKLMLAFVLVVSAAALWGVALAVLTDEPVLGLETAEWAVAFVFVQVVGLWAVVARLFVYYTWGR